MDTSKVNRFEVIDHSTCLYCDGQRFIEGVECQDCHGLGCQGRKVIMWDDAKSLNVELQDNGRTLKVFIHERVDDADL